MSGPRIFLSYARGDHAAALELRSRIEAQLGMGSDLDDYCGEPSYGEENRLNLSSYGELCYDDGTIRIWDIASRSARAMQRAHQEPICCLRADARGRIFTASQDGTIRRWDTTKVAWTERGPEHPREVRKIRAIDRDRAMTVSRIDPPWSFNDSGYMEKHLHWKRDSPHISTLIEDSADSRLSSVLVELGSEKVSSIEKSARDAWWRIARDRGIRVLSAAVRDGNTLEVRGEDGELIAEMQLPEIGIIPSPSKTPGKSQKLVVDLAANTGIFVSGTGDGEVGVWRCLQKGGWTYNKIGEFAGSFKGTLSSPGRPTLRLVDKAVCALRFICSSRFVIGIGEDATVRIWSVCDLREVYRLDSDVEFTAMDVIDSERLVVLGESMGRVHWLEIGEPSSDT